MWFGAVSFHIARRLRTLDFDCRCCGTPIITPPLCFLNLISHWIATWPVLLTGGQLYLPRNYMGLDFYLHHSLGIALDTLLNK